MNKKKVYKRILLKLSGESLMKHQKSSISHESCIQIAKEIKTIYDLGVEIGIVIGGGNIFRGSQAKLFGLSRTPADHIGMLATAINGLFLGQALLDLGCKTRVVSALNFGTIIEIYNWSQALLYLKKGVILIFVAGTGNPYFSTDTAAALRANEINAEVLFKATKVDGIYDKDPEINKDAIKYEKLKYSEFLSKDLHVMDAAAVALCMSNSLPIHVFNLFKNGAFLRSVCGEKEGSIIV